MREYTETLEYRVAQSEVGGGGGEQQLQISNSILQDRLSHFSRRASCFVEFQDVGLRMRACARVYNKE